jgi:hypothetical protein
MIRSRKRPAKVEIDEDDAPPVLEAETINVPSADEVQFQAYVSSFILLHIKSV